MARKGQIGGLSWDQDGISWGVSRLSWGRIDQVRVLRDLRWKSGSAEHSPPYVGHVLVLRTHPKQELLEYLSEVSAPELWEAFIVELDRRAIPTEVSWTRGAPVVHWREVQSDVQAKTLGPYRGQPEDRDVLVEAELRIVLPGPEVGRSLARAFDASRRVTTGVLVGTSITGFAATLMVDAAFLPLAIVATLPLSLSSMFAPALKRRRSRRRGRPRLARVRLRNHWLECVFVDERRGDRTNPARCEIEAATYDGFSRVSGGRIALWFGRDTWMLVSDPERTSELIVELGRRREAQTVGATGGT